MANTIQIKRSTTNAAPSSLAAGEIAYSSNSNKFFIGHPDGSTGNVVIGGDLYVNMLDHTAGILTASSSIIVDSNSKIDQLLIDNMRFGTTANTIDTSTGNLAITVAGGVLDFTGGNIFFKARDNSTTGMRFGEGTTPYITLDTSDGAEKIITGKQLQISGAYTLPTADGSSGQALITNGSGAVTFTTISTNLTVGADSGSNDVVSLISDVLEFTGGEGIDTTVSNNTITIAAEDATSSNKGVASFDSTDFTVSSGAVSVNATTLGSTALNPGATTTVIAGVTQLDVDNVRIFDNSISTTDSNGNLSLEPQGTGSVVVPSGYKNRSGFGTNSLVTKEYVDALKQSLNVKDSVRVATTANISLSGTQTIDGAAISAGQRVLVKNQSTAADNGIYLCAVGAWSRAADADSSADLSPGTFVFVELGTVGGDNGFVLTNDSVNLGSTGLTFTQFSGAGQIIGGDAITKSGNTLSLAVDNKTLQINSDAVRIKGVGATAIGDLLVGQASDGGYTALAKPTGNATAHDYILSMNTSGAARWANTLDGGTF
jgi:hypothetical protein